MDTEVIAFDDTPARDIMTHSTDVEFISLHASEQEIIDTVESSGKSDFRCTDKDFDDVVGVLCRDFLMADAGERRHLKGLLRAPYFIPESISADSCLKICRRKNSLCRCY